MLSRRVFVFGAVPALAAALLASRTASARQYYRGQPSDHFDGKRFFNPGGEAPRSFGDLLRWQLGGGRVSWPKWIPSPFPSDKPPARVDGDALRITLVGHATFLIQTGGLNILTDPVWSNRASPFGFAGPRRFNLPGIAFDDLPKIDVVLLSHNHYDHLDERTIRRLWRRDRPKIVTPLGNDELLRAQEASITATALDWLESVPLGAETVAYLEPAHHWSARGMGDRNRALWGAFVIKSGWRTIYFGGDTGFAGGRLFRATATRHPGIDLALLPIGAYEPRWFMAPQHINPDEAVQAMQLLGAKLSLGCHWGTFRLTNEGAEEPARDLAAACLARGVEGGRFVAARPGQVWLWSEKQIVGPATASTGAGDARTSA